MKKITILILLSTILLASQTKIAKFTYVCCPKSEQQSEVNELLENKRALAMYMLKNNCELVEKGRAYKIIDPCKGLLCQYKGILVDTGKKYCPREMFDK